MVLGNETVSSQKMATFYVTLASLSQIAVRLENTASLSNSSSAACNDSVNDTAGLEMRALSAIVSQVVRDACNYVSPSYFCVYLCI